MSENKAAQRDDSDNDEGTSHTTPLPGPVVMCVVLRAPVRQAIVEDVKVAAIAEAEKPSNERETDTKSSGDFSGAAIEIDEVEVDTTPQKNEVEKVLGGPFTFIGQYDDEGIVLMARRGLVEEKKADNDNNDESTADEGTDFASMSLNWNANTENVIEKQELIDSLEKKELELPLINPHQLKPPLHNVRVRGDILILRVPEGDEPLDSEEAGDEDENDSDENDSGSAVNEASTEEQKIENKDAFFLSYTKAEYLRFIVAPIAQNGHSDDDDDENEKAREGDNDGDEEFQMAAAALEEMTEEEEKSAMLNIVMAELLRKFREENERGANSREVLEIRGTFASVTLSVSCSLPRIHILFLISLSAVSICSRATGDGSDNVR